MSVAVTDATVVTTPAATTGVVTTATQLGNGFDATTTAAKGPGVTPYSQCVADAAAMLKADPAMAARVAAVYRRYGAVALPRQEDEDVVSYDRRVVRSYLEAPDRAAKAAAIAASNPDEDPNAPFFIVDLGQMVIQMAKFRKNLLGVAPYYAVKCNNSEPLIAMIHALGGNFDCASLTEIKAVIDPAYAHMDLNTTNGPSATSSTVAAGTTTDENKHPASHHEHHVPLVPPPQVDGNIIYANPAKPPFHMQRAEALGVRRVTFDNIAELEKIKHFMPSADAVLRIRTNDQNAACEFSSKFGCPMAEARPLLLKAKELGVNIAGVSFHVGSGNNDVTAYHQALRDARALFDFGLGECGFDMRVVDLGGGWAGVDPKIIDGKEEFMCFEDLTAALRPVLYELFPADQYELIAEPGRYFATSSHTLALSVESKRLVTRSVAAAAIAAAKNSTPADAAHAAAAAAMEAHTPTLHPTYGHDSAAANAPPAVNDNGQFIEYQYYLTDGIYQSFSCVYFDHVTWEVLPVYPKPERPVRTTTLFGPTCDGIDVMMKRVPFPEMEVDEWLVVPEFGAYTVSAGTTFNGYSTKRREYISSLPVGIVPV
jgi:ornithine decarboxylase